MAHFQDVFLFTSLIVLTHRKLTGMVKFGFEDGDSARFAFKSGRIIQGPPNGKTDELLFRTSGELSILGYDNPSFSAQKDNGWMPDIEDILEDLPQISATSYPCMSRMFVFPTGIPFRSNKIWANKAELILSRIGNGVSTQYIMNWIDPESFWKAIFRLINDNIIDFSYDETVGVIANRFLKKFAKVIAQKNGKNIATNFEKRVNTESEMLFNPSSPKELSPVYGAYPHAYKIRAIAKLAGLINKNDSHQKNISDTLQELSADERQLVSLLLK
ncbi:MAG TPA: hypothetical protein PLX04_01660 [Caldisericia bacterium]|nr:hypothetical protein [Caldisericia bacterium]HOR47281.1 hypothetical protein [Caldisericia bacterium]HOU07637.1 hypothetical protein [Caldisericia bacterium]HPL88954.1 hypothetical protein [Caldisericia bacterium]HQG59459.1 hypothetical protein [Caldisericia bacterium]